MDLLHQRVLQVFLSCTQQLGTPHTLQMVLAAVSPVDDDVLCSTVEILSGIIRCLCETLDTAVLLLQEQLLQPQQR
jgi:hypothetical protein